MNLINKALRRSSTSEKKPPKPSSGKKKINLALQGGGRAWPRSPGACSTNCSTTSGSRLRACPAHRPAPLMRGDGRGRSGPRRRRGSAQAPRGFLGARPAATATCRSSTAPSRSGLFSLIPIAVTPFQPWFDGHCRGCLSPLRPQSAQRQSVEGTSSSASSISTRWKKTAAFRCFIAGDQCAHRPGLARVSAREDRRRRRDGVGRAAVSCFRAVEDRRRAVLGRRLHRQSADLSVLSAPPRPRTCWWCRSIRWCGRRKPHSSQEIMNRVNEITFNSSLIAEYRAIEFVRRLIDDGRAQTRHRTGRVPPHQCAPDRSRLHRQEAHGVEPAQHRFRFLRDAASRWPPRRAAVFSISISTTSGVRSTIDLREQMRAERNDNMPAGGGPAGEVAPPFSLLLRPPVPRPSPPSRPAGPPPRRSACRILPATTAAASGADVFQLLLHGRRATAPR